MGSSLLWLPLFMNLLSSELVKGFDSRNTNMTTKEPLKIGLLVMTSFGYSPIRWHFFGPALPMSVEYTNAEEVILSNYTVEWVVRDSGCDPRKAVASLVKLVQEEDIDVVIGPACSTACVAAGYLAAAWNVPVISFLCGSEDLNNKNMFNTFLRTTATYHETATAMISLLKQQNWQTMTIMWTTVYIFYRLVKDPMIRLGEQHNMTIYDYPHDLSSMTPGMHMTPEDFYEHLREVSKLSRGKLPFSSSSRRSGGPLLFRSSVAHRPALIRSFLLISRTLFFLRLLETFIFMAYNYT